MKQETITEELNELKKEINMLKERQEFLEDSLLSGDDVKALDDARNDMKSKKTVPLSAVKKKLGL